MFHVKHLRGCLHFNRTLTGLSTSVSVGAIGPLIWVTGAKEFIKHVSRETFGARYAK